MIPPDFAFGLIEARRFGRAPSLAQVVALTSMLQPLHSNAPVSASEAVREPGGKSSLAEEVG